MLMMSVVTMMNEDAFVANLKLLGFVRDTYDAGGWTSYDLKNQWGVYEITVFVHYNGAMPRDIHIHLYMSDPRRVYPEGEIEKDHHYHKEDSDDAISLLVHYISTYLEVRQ